MSEQLAKLGRMIMANKRTSAIGLALIAVVLHKAAHDPTVLFDPQVWLKLLEGLGFLFVADAIIDDDDDDEPTAYGFGIA